MFLDSWNRTVMPFSVAELRVTAERRAESTLLITGRRIAHSEDLVDLAWRHRVRTGGAVSRAFLAALRQELGITELVIVQLIVEPARLVVLARSLETDTGVVRRVWIDEEPIVPLLSGADPELEERGLKWALASGFGTFADAEQIRQASAGSPVGCFR